MYGVLLRAAPVTRKKTKIDVIHAFTFLNKESNVSQGHITLKYINIKL
jgi:hypothetical protein